MPFLGTEQPKSAEEQDSAKALKKALKASKKMAQQNGDVAEQANVARDAGDVGTAALGMAQLPSPFSSAPSSKLTIAHPPSRLTSLIPPPNYGTVEQGTIFRSGFPQAMHLDFMESMKIRSILSLVDTEPSEEFYNFMDAHGIQRNHLSIAANKEGSKMDPKTICDAIIFAKEPKNQPVYIHCNQGKHRTGCVVACLRKYQGKPLDEILTEYKAYAHPKERLGDIEFIKAFDPKMVDAYAKCYAHSGVSPKKFRVDSKLDIWELSASIPDDFAKSGYSDTSMSSSYESGSDMLLMSPLPAGVGSIVASWTQVRDFGIPSSSNVKHDNEAGICSAEVIRQTHVGSLDICDGDSDWDDSDTVAISATATTPPIAVSARSSFSS